ncbi:hypothetical protein CDCA_CDCA15G4035 [Cyanidium caldarium]|uniref:Uncharacterized protein n=1 Tax=Cyanidium caldarium TaxID=2771 RepID=A0AAV9J098_CYACA|nr:hypothetical protein CDCA_CDCA15G4035 [Cyanidium caldarium]
MSSRGAAGGQGIRPLEAGVRRRVCAGVAIASVAAAVKELVENALDAGATRVDVTLVDSGLESIEVADDGSGIRAEDLPRLCEAYTTSKWPAGASVTEAPDSYGFRGQALSALAHLSQLEVVTRCGDGSADCPATRAVYAADGRLQRCEPAARAVGTTVRAASLFGSVPVRRREAVAQSKRQLQHALRQVQALALGAPQVRLRVGLRSATVSAAMATPHWTLVTDGGGDLSKAVAAVFGVEQLRALMPVEMECRVSSGLPSGSDPTFYTVRVSGLVSRPLTHCGRKSADRQVFLLQGRRPVLMPKLARAVSALYRQANRWQPYPALVLQVWVPRAHVDINLAPDKSQALLRHESELIEALERHLRGVWLHSETHPVVSGALADYDGVLGVQRGVGAPVRAARYVTEMHRKPRQDAKRAEAEEGALDGPENAEEEERRASRATLASAGSHRVDRADASSQSDAPEEHTHDTSSRRVQVVRVIDGKAQRALRAYPMHRKRRRIGAPEASPLQYAHIGEWSTVDDRAPDTASSTPPSAVATVALQAAEAELERTFHKRWFDDMRIVGQFNLGFIVARHADEVYIIDQHAADEKFHYERLQQSAVCHVQRLVRPVTAAASSNDELLLREHEAALTRAGFTLAWPDGGPTTGSARLLTVPCIDGYTFDRDDALELAHAFHAAPYASERPRPPRLNALLASRACRKSIMIGMPLDRHRMLQVVRHLTGLAHPWNCPHGRPTLRHLLSLREVYAEGGEEGDVRGADGDLGRAEVRAQPRR